MCCINATFVAIELKKSKYDEETPLQNFKLQKIASCGGISIVVSPESWETAYSFLLVLATEGLSKAKENIH